MDMKTDPLSSIAELNLILIYSFLFIGAIQLLFCCITSIGEMIVTELVSIIFWHFEIRIMGELN